MNPMNKLPQSPRKMVAGLKLNRKKPRMDPARASVNNDTNGEPLKMATTKTTTVENNAEPAARPSKPSIRLNAFVIPITQRTVMGSPMYQAKCLVPNNTGSSRILMPPAKSITAATP
jgi:hypothetical protein